MRRDLTLLAQRQTALERKLDEMDARFLVLSRRLAPERSDRSPPRTPDMPVVRLAPRPAPPRAPPLFTQVPVREPTADQLAEIEDAAPVEKTAVAAGDTGEYQEALSAVSTGDVDRGIGLLEAFVKANPRHPDADNALLTLGVAYAQSGDPALAAAALSRAIAEYPAGDAVPEALLRLADCQLKLKNPVAARGALTRLVREFPGTPASRQAESRLASLPQPVERRPRAARSPQAR